MPGPIVRSGPNEQYASNWAKAFGAKTKKKKAAAPKATQKKAASTKKKKK